MEERSPYWAERFIHYLDKNFDRYKTVFEIALTLAILIIPFTFSQLNSLLQKYAGGEIMQDPVLSPVGIATTLLFYIIAFCIWMLIKNNARSTKANRLREDKMVLLLEAIAKKMGVDTEALSGKTIHKEQHGQETDNGEQSTSGGGI